MNIPAALAAIAAAQSQLVIATAALEGTAPIPPDPIPPTVPDNVVVLTDQVLTRSGYNPTLDGQNIAVGVGDAIHQAVCSDLFIAALPFKGHRVSFIKNTPTTADVECCVSPNPGDFTYRAPDGSKNYLMIPPGTDSYDFYCPDGFYFNTRSPVSQDNGWLISWHAN